MVFRMTDLPDRPVADHPVREPPPRLKAELEIYQSEHSRTPCRVGHLSRLGETHRHRFFAKDVLAGLECGQGHLAMKFWRRGDTDKVDIVAGHGLAPVGCEMRNTELVGGRRGVSEAAACDGYDLGTVTRKE